MAKRVAYPFRLIYRQGPGGMYQVREAIVTTDVGTARLIRR